MNREILESHGLKELADLYEAGLCTRCKKIITVRDFRGHTSIMEYLISGKCQTCQDMVYGTKPKEK